MKILTDIELIPHSIGDILRGGTSIFERLPIGASGQVLTVSGGLPTWQNPIASSGGGGGGGGSTPYAVTTGTAAVVIPGLAASPDIAGKNGTVVSYEFDSGSLFTWSAAVASEDINTTHPSHYYIVETAGTDHFGYYAFAPGSSDFDARIKFSQGALTTTNFGATYLYIADASNSERMLIGQTPTNNRVGGISSYRYTGGGYAAIGNTNFTNIGMHSTWYFRITRTGGSSWDTWFSFDGIAWHKQVPAQSQSFTVARLGILLNGDPQEVAIDWLRVK